MRKAAFYLSVLFLILALIFATGIQALPFLAIAVLTGFNVYTEKDLRVWIIVLSVLMVLINLSLFSWIDIVAWAAIGLLSLERGVKETTRKTKRPRKKKK